MLYGFEIFGIRVFDFSRAFGYAEVFGTLALIGVFTVVMLAILSSMTQKNNTKTK